MILTTKITVMFDIDCKNTGNFITILTSKIGSHNEIHVNESIDFVHTSYNEIRVHYALKKFLERKSSVYVTESL